MKIDAHHHLWQYSAEEYDWIDASMSVLKKDFLIPELEKTLQENAQDGSVVVQARQSLAETHWLIELATRTDKIKGIVGWVDLKSDNLEAQLIEFKQHSKVKGFRHVLQGEPDPAFMLDAKFIAGLKLLAKHGFTYDLLVYAGQLPNAIKMLEQVPELKVVIDHIAKPDIKHHSNIAQWQANMRLLATRPQTYCKISGMVTEADWQHWQYSDLTPYLDAVFSCFEVDRIMYGSDWPVCLVAASYHRVKAIVEAYLQDNHDAYIELIFGLNACRFYQLD